MQTPSHDVTPMRLMSYVTAAGLGAFTVGQQADAAIVYTDVPDVSIGQGEGPIYINLDSAGQNEFAVGAFLESIRVNPYNIGSQQNLVLTSGDYYVNAFDAGEVIGAEAAVAGGARFAARQVGSYFYNFVGTDGFVGLKWDIGGGHFIYAWAAIDVTGTSGATSVATLKAFAYESTPNTAIIAGDVGVVPEPGSLALLAAGAGALAFRRRRDVA